MATVQATQHQAKTGVAGTTTQVTTIEVRLAQVELLIGGPYVDKSGANHTYGHTALRVVTKDNDYVYDFGRYAGSTGDFGAEGPGILRVWSNFNRYIASENAYGRRTTGFTYDVSETDALRINHYYQTVIANAKLLNKRQFMNEYKLSRNYHALGPNCVTVSMEGARLGLPNISAGSAKYNEGRGLSFAERAAAKLSGWPAYLFMPSDLQAFLQNGSSYKPKLIQTYGNAK